LGFLSATNFTILALESKSSDSETYSAFNGAAIVFLDQITWKETAPKTRAFASGSHNSGQLPRVSNRTNFVAIETALHGNASTSCLGATHADGLESDDLSPLSPCGRSTLQFALGRPGLSLWLYTLPFIQYNPGVVSFIPRFFEKTGKSTSSHRGER
jgi:hypothetical protein